MPNPRYESGRRFEYRQRDAWRERGYEVMRTAGSHGPYDLIAVHPRRPVVLIQCKVVKTQAEAERLIRTFKKSPPLLPSGPYTQVMEVWVRKVKRVVSGWV